MFTYLDTSQTIHYLRTSTGLFWAFSESLGLLTGLLSNRSQLHSIAQQYHQPTQLIYLFSSPEQLQRYSASLPNHAKLLLRTTSSGAIFFNLPSNPQNPLEDSTFTAYIPHSTPLQEIISQLSEPLVSLLPVNSFNLPLATPSSLEDSQWSSLSTYVLPPKHKPSGLLPTTVSLSLDTHVEVTYPGVISYREISQTLSSSVPVTQNYQPHLFTHSHSEVAFYRTSTLPTQTPGLTLILGTKEKLKQEFDLTLGYFQIKQIDNYILLNLGSQTNLETVAKNYAQNLDEALKLGVHKRVLLTQDWGHTRWGEILKALVTRSTRPVTTQAEWNKLGQTEPHTKPSWSWQTGS
jgi:tRNA A37 threonylcarbamoyladenosine synthetase subunit TsaC/SUA5/YrdC